MRSAWRGYEYPLTNTLGRTYPQRKDFVFGQFAAYLSQLEYLATDVSSFEGKQAFSKVPLLSNLKHLSLTGSNNSGGPYGGVVFYYQMAACFIKASPFLRRLELHFLQLPGLSQALRRIRIPPCKHLKEVLVSGFQGDMFVSKFIVSIFDYAIALEKIDITTAFLGGFRKCYYNLDKQDDLVHVRSCIHQLRRRLPRNALLNFLDDD